MFGQALQQSCMAMCVFCSTSLTFVFAEENDDSVCCQLCGHRPSDISECGTCHLNMCASCMPLHSCTLQG